MTKNRVTRAIDEYDGDVMEDTYEYRGIRFERNDSLKGYWGHYRTYNKLGKVHESTSTRKDMLKIIDNYLDRKL